jgi:hypothetical protein
MWGTPPGLKGFAIGDDDQDPDIFPLVGIGVGPTPTDLLWANQGSTGPITPTNYTLKVTQVTAGTGAASGQTLKFYAQNTVAATSAQVLLAEFTLGVQGTIQFNNDLARLVVPPNCKLQAAFGISGDVVVLARYIKGAGWQ